MKGPERKLLRLTSRRLIRSLSPGAAATARVSAIFFASDAFSACCKEYMTTSRVQTSTSNQRKNWSCIRASQAHFGQKRKSQEHDRQVRQIQRRADLNDAKAQLTSPWVIFSAPALCRTVTPYQHSLSRWRRRFDGLDNRIELLCAESEPASREAGGRNIARGQVKPS